MVWQYYNYLMLEIIQFMKSYENISEISISQIVEIVFLYIEMLLKELGESKNTKDISEFLSQITNENFHNLFENFLNTYRSFFYLNNETLYLREEITLDDIEEEIKEAVFDNMDLVYLYTIGDLDYEEKDKIKEILNINTIDNTLGEYLQIESLLEYLYKNSDGNEYVKKEIGQLLKIRSKFFEVISNMNLTKLKTYQETALSIKYKNLKLYRNYPIQFDKKLDQVMEDYFDVMFYDINQYAIFNESLNCYNYLEEKISNAYYKATELQLEDDLDYEYYDFASEIDEYEDEIFDTEKSMFSFDENVQNYFYLTYILKINEYIKISPSIELMEVKSRLLYILDSSNYCLYLTDKNIELALSDLEIDEIENKFIGIEKEIYYMLNDIFISYQKDNPIKKILFIATYYQLTRDLAIVKLLSDFKNHPKYQEYKDIILSSKGKNRIL